MILGKRSFAIVVLFLCFWLLAEAAQAGRYGDRPRYMDRFAWAVAMCETQANPRHNSGSYGGAFGWYVGTWQLDRYEGMPRYPWNATLAQQYKVFQRGRQRGRYWGCIANGGYRSHLGWG